MGGLVRLAFFIFRYFPHGGLQRNFLHVAGMCLDRGYEVSVYTLNWVGPKPQGIQVNEVKVSGWTNDGRALQFAKQVPVILKSEKIDVAIGFNKMPGMDINYVADPCYVERIKRKYYSWKEALVRSTPRYRNFRWLEKSVFEDSDSNKILVLTAQEEQIFRQHYHTPANRLHVLPPGFLPDRVPQVDRETIRQAWRQKLGLSDDQFSLLLIGRAFQTKGLDRAMKAIAALPENLRQQTRLLAVGDPRTTWFKGLARWLGVYDQILWLPCRDDISEIMACADALIHPARADITGGVILEAMATGLPVLTTEVCGFASLVNSAKAGMVLPSPFDQQNLNEALRDFMISNQKDEWGKNGQKFLDQKDFQQHFQMVVDILEETAKEKAC